MQTILEPVSQTVKKPEAPSPERQTITHFMGIAFDSTTLATPLAGWTLYENGAIGTVEVHEGIFYYTKSC